MGDYSQLAASKQLVGKYHSSTSPWGLEEWWLADTLGFV